VTLIAGASLFNGVILLSDARATIRYPGKPDIHCDIDQKLLPLTPSTALGFFGDISTASFLIHTAIRQLPSRTRKDADSLALWLPRFLRAAFALSTNHGQSLSWLVLSSRIGPTSSNEKGGRTLRDSCIWQVPHSAELPP
jgi:hypothetical protein